MGEDRSTKPSNITNHEDPDQTRPCRRPPNLRRHAGTITNAIAEDGILTGLEAALLNLQGTELVILSACDSGTGEVKIGEGVMSLRRAFRIAGAETVLASHWPVSDQATSRLMTEFMRRWQAGESRSAAWRGAQLSLLQSKDAKDDFSDPYFWAAFTLTGQWRR
jgi:CHAT domain-containing protein